MPPELALVPLLVVLTELAVPFPPLVAVPVVTPLEPWVEVVALPAVVPPDVAVVAVVLGLPAVLCPVSDAPGSA